MGARLRPEALIVPQQLTTLVRRTNGSFVPFFPGLAGGKHPGERNNNPSRRLMQLIHERRPDLAIPQGLDVTGASAALFSLISAVSFPCGGCT
jgi:hypothetical protein